VIRYHIIRTFSKKSFALKREAASKATRLCSTEKECIDHWFDLTKRITGDCKLYIHNFDGTVKSYIMLCFG